MQQKSDFMYLFNETTLPLLIYLSLFLTKKKVSLQNEKKVQIYLLMSFLFVLKMHIILKNKAHYLQ